MPPKNSKSIKLQEQFKPQNQKSLFNQTCVSEIKKFIKELTSQNHKKILFLYGQSGCGKKATISILFKNYNLIHIDADNIRFLENISDIINGISSFGSQNLSQFEKKPTKSHIGNILVLNNIQHCEKTLLSFLDTLYIKYNRNIPIILICNKQQIRQRFKSDFSTTFIDFLQPTHEELTELITTVNVSQNLKLSKESIQKIIETSMYDIHQVFHILEYLQLNKHPDVVRACTRQGTINDDINIITNLQKDHDVDLHNKMEYLFDFTKEFNFQKVDELTQADSSVISNTIFQNYTKLFNNSIILPKDHHDLSSVRDRDQTYTSQDPEPDFVRAWNPTPFGPGQARVSQDLEVLADISNSLCNDLNDVVFDLQNHSDTINYNSYYNIINCVEPIYKLHENKRNVHLLEENVHSVKNEKQIVIENFKNYSYNNINSFEELKTLTFNSSNNIHGNKEGNKILFLHDNKNDLWILINTFIQMIININKTLETKKRNIKLEENINIIKKDKNAFEQVTLIVETIWDYTLFETNENITKIKYNQDEITIDIKIFKKYINIFTFENNSKVMKLSTENVIKYFLKKKIINLQNEKIVNNKISEIDKLTYDLSDIWSCMKN